MVLLPTVSSLREQMTPDRENTDFVHYSNMSWTFLRIFERNRTGNFLIVLSLILPLGHYWSPYAAFPLISKVLTGNSIPDKLLKMKYFFCPNPSVGPGRFPLVSLFSLPYSSVLHVPYTSLQTKSFTWVSGSPLTHAASASAFSTGIYQMAALACLQLWVLVAEPHAFIATALRSTLTGIDKIDKIWLFYVFHLNISIS